MLKVSQKLPPTSLLLARNVIKNLFTIEMLAHLCKYSNTSQNSLEMLYFLVSGFHQSGSQCITETNVFLLISFNHYFDDFEEVLYISLEQRKIFYSNLSTQEILISCPDFLGSFCQQTTTVFGKEFGPLVLLVWKLLHCYSKPDTGTCSIKSNNTDRRKIKLLIHTT